MLLLSFCKYWPFLLVAIKSFTVFSFISFEHMFYNVCIYFISTKHSNFLQCTRCSSSLICGGERIHSLSRVYFWDFGRSPRLLYQSFDRRCPKVCAIYECCYSGWLGCWFTTQSMCWWWASSRGNSLFVSAKLFTLTYSRRCFLLLLRRPLP